MMLGLVRHFKVEHPHPGRWLTAEQFDQWNEGYETAPIRRPEARGNEQQWDLCLCSDQARAVHTASYFAAKEFIYSGQLREVGITAFRPGKLKLGGLRLPVSCWLVFGRLAWAAGHPSQPESRAAVRQRAATVIDKLLAEAESALPEGRVLMVSHGVFMKMLDDELRRRGYKGQRMGYPHNGLLYKYEKQ
ncbi:histidine phosphatase family protein [Paenibacillus sp. MMS20-IR301]|uniref:histidine phosphatase family protein n=1 Tax=Paenibacillus sp. MMS20-IR301 TaxID=2895946 RepID=UPI0028EF3913|nr:histidine phosphatase family protein [Paenibacillus sp. MMS20-IR301]WNS45901.1 histidine phosphatase family protein [Paenibacillus sp. MMS20-IR301]